MVWFFANQFDVEHERIIEVQMPAARWNGNTTAGEPGFEMR
jgi:hypothetical protein